MSAIAVVADLTDLRNGAKLKITHPTALANKYKDGLIKSSLGNFGHI
jgi:hypothetical protein